MLRHAVAGVLGAALCVGCKPSTNASSDLASLSGTNRESKALVMMGAKDGFTMDNAQVMASALEGSPELGFRVKNMGNVTSKEAVLSAVRSEVEGVQNGGSFLWFMAFHGSKAGTMHPSKSSYFKLSDALSVIQAARKDRPLTRLIVIMNSCYSELQAQQFTLNDTAGAEGSPAGDPGKGCAMSCDELGNCTSCDENSTTCEANPFDQQPKLELTEQDEVMMRELPDDDPLVRDFNAVGGDLPEDLPAPEQTTEGLPVSEGAGEDGELASLESDDAPTTPATQFELQDTRGSKPYVQALVVAAAKSNEYSWGTVLTRAIASSLTSLKTNRGATINNLLDDVYRRVSTNTQTGENGKPARSFPNWRTFPSSAILSDKLFEPSNVAPSPAPAPRPSSPAPSTTPSTSSTSTEGFTRVAWSTSGARTWYDTYKSSFVPISNWNSTSVTPNSRVTEMKTRFCSAMGLSSCSAANVRITPTSSGAVNISHLPGRKTYVVSAAAPSSSPATSTSPSTSSTTARTDAALAAKWGFDASFSVYHGRSSGAKGWLSRHAATVKHGTWTSASDATVNSIKSDFCKSALPSATWCSPSVITISTKKDTAGCVVVIRSRTSAIVVVP